MINRNIIVTADDYGMCGAVNEAIEECVALGTITSTNVMVNMPAHEAAVSFRRRYPNVALGLHWTICQGSPVLPPDRVSSLVNGHGGFWSAREIRRRWPLGLIKAAHVQAELVAQYRRFVDLVGVPDYWNSHQNTHVYPGLFPLFVRTGLACGINAMRSHRRVLVTHQGNTGSFHCKHPVFFAKGIVINQYSRWAEHQGVWMPRGLVCASGYDKASQIAMILTNPCLPASQAPIEFVVHPSTREHPELFGDVVASRVIEYRTLKSESLRRELAGAGVRLCTFGRTGNSTKTA
jgi:predicted glycoside hydrolase/deacetylase ChbG (UPF0249 family)